MTEAPHSTPPGGGSQPTGPAGQGRLRVAAGIQLDPEELLVARAQRRICQIVDQLIVTPINRRAYADMREYLATDAWPAADAYDALRSRSPEQLSARLGQILSTTGDESPYPPPDSPEAG